MFVFFSFSFFRVSVNQTSTHADDTDEVRHTGKHFWTWVWGASGEGKSFSFSFCDLVFVFFDFIFLKKFLVSTRHQLMRT